MGKGASCRSERDVLCVIGVLKFDELCGFVGRILGGTRDEGWSIGFLEIVWTVGMVWIRI